MSPAELGFMEIQSPIAGQNPFYAEEGGFRSDSSRGQNKFLYYIGVIDIFTQYSGKKKLETAFRALSKPKTEISAVDPILYGTRFMSFISKSIADEIVR